MMKKTSLFLYFFILIAFFFLLGTTNHVSAYTINHWAPSAYMGGTPEKLAIMEQNLGISGAVIEDFEDLYLIPGLTITGADYNGLWTNCGWGSPNSGANILSVSKTNPVTINLSPGVELIGIGFGWLEYYEPPNSITHEMIINDDFSITLTPENFPKFAFNTNNERNPGYITIKAEGSHLINSVTFVVLDSSYYDLDDYTLDYIALKYPKTPTFPFTPHNVVATPGDRQINLTWNDISDTVSYNIYWSTTSGVTKSNGIKISNITNPYTHTNLNNGESYFYVITAEKNKVEGSESTEVIAIPFKEYFLGPPANLTASADNKQIALSWDNVQEAIFYNIYWSTSSGVTKSNGTKISNITTTSYIHTNLINGESYFYVITAENNDEESNESEEVTSTPFAIPIAQAGADQIVFNEVTLDGTGSYDPDGTIELYEWKILYRDREYPEYDRTADGEMPTIPELVPGFYDVSLKVTDNDGGISTADTMLLAVADENDCETLIENSEISLVITLQENTINGILEDTNQTATLSCGITVSPSASFTTIEDGGTVTFTMVLTTKPSADVTINLESSDETEGTVSPQSLIFTPDNWNIEQIVTITSVDDDIVDGNVSYTILIAPAISEDTGYRGLLTNSIEVTNNDNDTNLNDLIDDKKNCFIKTIQ